LSDFPDNLGDVIPRDGGDATAIIDLGGEGGPRDYSYRAIDEMAAGVAAGLTKRGLQRGDSVAIVSMNRAEYLIAFLGIMRAGMVAVPVNFKLPRATIEHILRDSDAKLVFCDAGRAALMPAELPHILFNRDGKDAFAAFAQGSFDPIHPANSEPALILYTSGSSGTPKGVVLSHQSHLWVLRARPRPPGAGGQHVLVAAPLYHMNGLGTSQGTLNQRNVIVILPSFTAASYLDAIDRYKCSVVTAVPPMIAMALREEEIVRRSDLTSVKLIRVGSAPVSQVLIDATHEAFPNAAIFNAYGTTEAGPVVFGPHPKGLPTPALSPGYPHPEVQMRLGAEDKGGSAEGVLQMKCPALMNGYRNRPDATRAVMTDDGLYITGDLFSRDADGFYYFVGRADDMFVSSGENVYPTEVERMLEQHPDIDQASVVPVPDDIKGTKPVAFVVRKPGTGITEQAIKEFALKNAAPYLHPRRVWFLDDLPLAGTNKIDRKALMAMAAELVTRD
jgi:acyl-CoA synthetase (AMP-forming)/AMP-acid ligase II